MIARVVAETAATVTVEWDAVAGVGYRFLRDGDYLSHTWDPTKTRATFGKTAAKHVFEVQALLPDVARVTWPKAQPAGLEVPAWKIRLETSQTDPSSGGGNRFTFGWIKTRRRVPSGVGTPHWETEGLVEFADYPDEFVMVEAKRFDVGYPGRVTNFHLVGGDATGGGVSPLSADLRPGRSRDWPTDGSVMPGLVLTCQAELNDQRRGHWQILTDTEINVDRAVVWTLEWRIRWRQDRSGSVVLRVFRNGALFRLVQVHGIRTAYQLQRPRVYVWVGGYESSGLSSPAEVTQTMDYRGRTLEEAFAERPRLGQTIASVSTAGGPASSVKANGSLVLAK